MKSIDHIESIGCCRRELQEYLDGSLDQKRETALSDHLAGCNFCRNELNLQKQIINGIESALYDEPPVPHDFSRVVTAKAESQIGGLRTGNEWRTASVILVGFIAAVFVIIGMNFSAISGVFDTIGPKMFSVGSYIIHLVSDIAFGIGVIVRTVTSRVGDVESVYLIPVIIGAVALASFILYRQYFRRSINDGPAALKS